MPRSHDFTNIYLLPTWLLIALASEGLPYSLLKSEIPFILLLLLKASNIIKAYRFAKPLEDIIIGSGILRKGSLQFSEVQKKFFLWKVYLVLFICT